ncbi:uncharacterized protein [Choristoneura fumiferana]|uniref:uncharacterized protein n=1 Tax=Choristoneura fumiferana TaxID=7141 RepID=UPI003D156F77
MSEVSTTRSLPSNIYDETISEENSLDLSSQGLHAVPPISNMLLCMIYLQNNSILSLPDDFFPSLPNLRWLDIRDNQLMDIPKSIEGHPCLTHLLLQNNSITSLPNELGTVIHLKVLQLDGNPILYPPMEIIRAGTAKVMAFLHAKHLDGMFNQSQSQSELSEDAASTSGAFPASLFGQSIRSYNSVIDQDKFENNKTLSVKFNDKDGGSEIEEYYLKYKGKCPRLAESRTSFPPKTQSAKYLKPLLARSKSEQEAKMKRSFFRDVAVKKHKELLATREKIIQERKNAELLRQWRRSYRDCKQLAKGSYKMCPKNYPYDTNPEYMTLLTREDIEKDLPDKYRKKIIRRAKPTVPRKGNSDVNLAMRIKQLFENLESIELRGETMTPRTEQRVLLNEIQKISEIKQKLMELSVANRNSVDND